MAMPGPALAMPEGRPDELLGLARRLYPLPRSITGDGVRATLAALRTVVPLAVHEVPTGTAVLDWEVPPEWRVREAWVAGPDGRRIADFAVHNLHLVGYSRPFRGVLPLAALQEHLHSDPDRPDVIPYRTSYYADRWGFCLRHADRVRLPPGDYTVCVDTELGPGSLSYGEFVHRGTGPGEAIVYTHTCHPSLANDNVSGMVVAAWLARFVAAAPRRLTWRFVFGPGTIGSITWLARNAAVLPRVEAGFVLGLVGDAGPLRYKRSFGGRSPVDRAAAALLAAGPPGTVTDFDPWGYDERQFGSPGFRLAVGRLTRSAEEGYPQYHSSADDLALLSGESLRGALEFAAGLVTLVDANRTLRSLAPYGEPQLGRRGLYRSLGGPPSADLQRALLWVLSLADGSHDVIDVVARSGLPAAAVLEACAALAGAGLLAADGAGDPGA